MCRMLSFMTVEPLLGYEVEELIDALALMASRGRTLKGGGMGHPHGWGMVAFRSGRLILYVREVEAAWKRSFYQRFRADLAVVHARAASVGEVSFENTHPFEYRGWFLAHNGSVKVRSDKALGSTDTEAMLIELVDSSWPLTPESLAESIRGIREKVDSSMTFLLTSGEELYALKGAVKHPDYFNLYLLREERGVLLASQPWEQQVFTGEWKELDNWTLYRFYRDGGGGIKVESLSL